MAKITLYSSGCPRCKVLEKKLNDKSIKYNLFADVDKMVEMGFTMMPVLEVDGTRMGFKAANDWINERG